MDVLSSNKTVTSYDEDIHNFTIHEIDVVNSTVPSVLARRADAGTSLWDSGKIQIPLYSCIFLLAVVGNSLVILTLIVNRRMRTITNVFLLNLAASDLLLGVVCMPFTLIGALLRDFVFGEIMCKFIPFLQACSVAVSGWTLVAISVERYYAICHPLRALRWQTLSHAYHMIAAIWGASLLCMSPIALLSELKPTNKGHHKCRESWPNEDYERAYNLFLDVTLLVLPLVCLALTYSLITRTLWQGMKADQKSPKGTTVIHSDENNGILRNLQDYDNASNFSVPYVVGSDCYLTRRQLSRTTTLRRSNTEKSLTKKKRVIKMLFAVVLEFFLCWTPIYVINTIALFEPAVVYQNVGYTAISFLHLLAYSSSCCNPITYCFMSSSFRQSFVSIFGCKRFFMKEKKQRIVADSEFSMNAKTISWSNH